MDRKRSFGFFAFVVLFRLFLFLALSLSPRVMRGWAGPLSPNHDHHLSTESTVADQVLGSSRGGCRHFDTSLIILQLRGACMCVNLLPWC